MGIRRADVYGNSKKGQDPKASVPLMHFFILLPIPHSLDYSAIFDLSIIVQAY